MKYLLSFLFICSFFVSKSQILDFNKKKDYLKIIYSKNVSDFENYLVEHPKSKYNPEVIKRRDCLKKQNDWDNVKYSNDTLKIKEYISKYKYEIITCDIIEYNFNFDNDIETLENKLNKLRIDAHWNRINIKNNSLSIVEYENFNKKYPKSIYFKIANDTIKNRKKRIEKIEYDKKVQEDWKITKLKNNYNDFIEFNKKYTISKFNDSCLLNLKNFEQNDWDKACKTNTVKTYENFEKKYPEGYFFKEAEKKIIEIEFGKIKKENPLGNWSPMDVYKYNKNSVTSTIIMTNKTQYTIKVMFSGAESTRVNIKPNQTATIYLLNGKYTVSAKVDNPEINPYWGYEIYEGYSYSTQWIINTTFKYK